MTSEQIYQAFYDDYEKLNAFLHSHSYTGNPLGCAAALATLDIFDADNIIEKNRKTAQQMSKAVAHLEEHPHIAEIRQTGMILAIEMIKHKGSRTPYPWQERRGLRVYRHALEQGALLRPLGNVIYFMPPYIINEEQIHQLAAITTQGIELATADN